MASVPFLLPLELKLVGNSVVTTLNTQFSLLELVASMQIAPVRRTRWHLAERHVVYERLKTTRCYAGFGHAIAHARNACTCWLSYTGSNRKLATTAPSDCLI